MEAITSTRHATHSTQRRPQFLDMLCSSGNVAYFLAEEQNLFQRGYHVNVTELNYCEKLLFFILESAVAFGKWVVID